MITHKYVSTAPPVSGKVDSAAWNDNHTFAVSSATVDFGTTPTYNKSFTVTDAECTESKKVFICGTAASDEAEFDSITYAAKAGNGFFTVYAIVLPGPISGNRTFYYFLGE